MASVTVQELSKEQQWCRELRKFLKLKERRITIGKTDEQKMGRADEKVRDSLKQLAKLNPTAFAELGGRYKSLAEHAETLKAGDEDAMLVVTQELEVLAKQVEKANATAKLKNFKPGTDEFQLALKESEKKDDEYRQAFQKLDGSYQKLISKAGQYLEELNPMMHAKLSKKLPPLQEKKTKWVTAYSNTKETEFFDYARALTDLADIGDMYKAAKTEIEQLQAESLREAEYKGRYESKIERIKQVEQHLLGHIGLEVEIRKLETARTEANKLLQPTDRLPGELRYYSAFQELKKHVEKTSKFEADALSKEKKLLTGLMKDKDIKERVEAVQRALKELTLKGQELITTPEQEQHQREINAALGLASTDKQQGLTALQKKEQLFVELQRERSADRQQCNTLLPTVERNLKDLLYRPAPEQALQLSQWEELLRMAKVDMGNCDFDAARAILEGLERSTSEAVSTSTTKRSDYELRWNDKTHSDMRDFIREQAAQLKTDPQLRLEDTYHFKQLGHAEKRAAGGDFAGAIELLEALHSDTNRQLKRKSFASSPDLQKADQQVARELEACRKALEELTQKLTDAGDTGTAAKEHAARLQQVEEAWNQNKGVAVDADDLDAAGYITRIQALTSDYQRLSKDTRKLAGAIKGAEHREGERAFRQAFTEVELALEQLASCDLGTRYTALADERDKISKEAPDRQLGFSPAIQALGSLKTQIERAVQAAATDRQTALEDFNSKATVVRRALDELHDSVKDEMKSKQRKFFEPYFKELENEYAGLTGMRESQSLAMLRQGAVELTAMQQRIAQLKLDMDKPVGNLSELVATALGKKDQEFDEFFGLDVLFEDGGLENIQDPILSDKVAATFPLVIAALESLTNELKNENLATCKPTRKRLLEEDFKNLAGEVKSLAPADALKRLLPFQKALTAAIEAADTAAQRRAEFNTQLKPQVKAAFKTLTGYEPEAKLAKLFKDEKAYFAELGNEYVAAKGLIDTEDKELEALKKMRQLQTDIQGVTGSPGELEKQEQAAQQRQFNAQRDEEQWKMYVKQYNDVTLPRVADALKVEGADTTQYKDCVNLLKKAQDHFKKTHDLSGASAMLQLAKDRAEAAIKFPLGTAATARGELVKLAGRWKKSVTAFNTSIDAVIDNIDKAVAEEGITVKQTAKDDDSFDLEELFEDLSDVQQATKQAARTLNNLKRVFDANAFDGVISVMATKKVEPKAARAAREEGLREVRRYMDVLMNDPVIRKVMQTPRPFGIIEASALYTALRDLDLNLQRSV